MTDSGDDDGDEDDFDADDEFDVPPEMRTVCHFCGGAGMIADPKLAIINNSPRTVDNGRPCPYCETDGHFPGLLPPV